jgi:hypothetical protein
MAYLGEDGCEGGAALAGALEHALLAAELLQR